MYASASCPLSRAPAVIECAAAPDDDEEDEDDDREEEDAEEEQSGEADRDDSRLGLPLLLLWSPSAVSGDGMGD